jgi:hypothetical protein
VAARTQPPIGQPPARRQRPALEVAGGVEFKGPEPVRFERKPQFWDERKHTWYTPPAFDFPDNLPFPQPPTGGGGNMSLGKVTDAGGNQATVDLYDNGPDQDATQTGVTVSLPTLDPAERMNVGDWLPSIYQFTGADGNPAYVAYPPVWVS